MSTSRPRITQEVADVLRWIAVDVETRMPRLRDPDPLSDWGQGVGWMVDRLRNIARDAEPPVGIVLPPGATGPPTDDGFREFG